MPAQANTAAVLPVGSSTEEEEMEVQEMFERLQAQIGTAEQRNSERFEEIGKRFDQVDKRFDQVREEIKDTKHDIIAYVDKRIEDVDKRIEGVDGRLRTIESTQAEIKGKLDFVESYLLGCNDTRTAPAE